MRREPDTRDFAPMWAWFCFQVSVLFIGIAIGVLAGWLRWG